MQERDHEHESAELIDRGMRPPPTRIAPVTESIHGRTVVDDYRWLEGDNADPAAMGRVTPEVTAWTDAQNAYTRRVLDALPGRRALEQRLRPLMHVGAVTAPTAREMVRSDRRMASSANHGRSPEQESSKGSTHDQQRDRPLGQREPQGLKRYVYAKREGDQNQPLIYCREGLHGEDRLLIDPARLDASGLTTVTWHVPSSAGKLLAYGTYRAGDENTTLHLLDVENGRVLPLEIPNKVDPPTWMPDDSGFVYRNRRDADDPYSVQVMFHRMGTDPATDAVLFRQFTREEDEKLATTWGPNGHLSHDGRWLLLSYFVDTRSNDLWLVDFDAYLATGALERRVVSVGSTGSAVGTASGDTLYLHTNKGAPNGRVVAAPVGTPEEERWRDVVPERQDATVENVALAAGHLVVTYLQNASSRVEVFDLDGRSVGSVRLPGIGTAGVVTEPDATEAFLTFTSFNVPTSIYRFDVAEPDAEPELWARPDAPVDPALVEVEQVRYPSKDGTEISMFVVHRRGLVKDGRTPTLLTGYGGFSVSRTPEFSAPLFQWFEDGGVLALPNLRGGGEYGDAWHEAGMLGRKQNVFDDFFAAAEWLINNGYTNPDKLAVVGGSNGGLLTGAVVTQRPELVRAAVVAVPLLDMLRYQHFLMARYWVPEYGTAEDASQFGWLAEYSPYHRVVSGTAYPAVLLTAGEHDSRVHASHARKMAAKLQAATASDPAEKPVLLWVDRDGGHGQGKPLDLRLRDLVDQRIFLMWQLGMLEG